LIEIYGTVMYINLLFLLEVGVTFFVCLFITRERTLKYQCSNKYFGFADYMSSFVSIVILIQ